ncbi:hypothetical protein BDZ89DRAFT_1140700 [Hymenopellis radicata]|nr:hypothetical protein BDZ89DRAFT_1140700 [Hymenopellis radicata]
MTAGGFAAYRTRTVQLHYLAELEQCLNMESLTQDGVVPPRWRRVVIRLTSVYTSPSRYNTPAHRFIRRGHFKGWAWTFAIEGILTGFSLLLASLSCTTSYPETMKFRTEKEWAQVKALLKADSKGAPTVFRWKYLVDALKD